MKGVEEEEERIEKDKEKKGGGERTQVSICNVVVDAARG